MKPQVFYAIQRVSDGRFLPIAHQKILRGQTHAEFEGVFPPRLWSTKVGAMSCLRMWVQGKWAQSGSSNLKCVSPRNLNINDYRVVPVYLAPTPEPEHTESTFISSLDY